MPLVVHIIHRLDYGGLENGLVNLIQNMPERRYRHAIVCLTDYTGFRERITRKDVEVIALHKKEGKDPGVYVRLFRLLRDMRPDVVHTRNLAALECAVVARVAGVPARVHGEHGWDIYDLHGRNRKYRLLRRFCRRFVSRYVALSRHTRDWLVDCIGIPEGRISLICNGVDARRFSPQPRSTGRSVLFPDDRPGECIVFGTVGRMEPVKNPLLLVQAFILLLQRWPELRPRVRLAMIGEGSLRPQVESSLREAGVDGLACLPGARDDIDAVMRELDVFVLPSLNEGISNTILEAMASGLPVIATDVGGNPELVVDGVSGSLVPGADAEAMAAAMHACAVDREARLAQGREGRRLVEQTYSLEAMVNRYLELYDQVTATVSD